MVTAAPDDDDDDDDEPNKFDEPNEFDEFDEFDEPDDSRVTNGSEPGPGVKPIPNSSLGPSSFSAPVPSINAAAQMKSSVRLLPSGSGTASFSRVAFRISGLHPSIICTSYPSSLLRISSTKTQFRFSK